MSRITVIAALRPHDAQLAAMRAMNGVEVEVIEPIDAPRAVDAALLGRADVLACSLPPTNHEAMTKVCLIQIDSAGYSQLYPFKLHERGIRACNALGSFDVPIGEWVAAMLINLARDLRGMIRHQEQGVWDRDARFQTEIRGKTLGIWGYGGIGRESARLAKALGLTVHVLARNGVGPRRDKFVVPGTGDVEGVLPDRVFAMDERDAFLSGLDYLLLAMPHTPATEGIVDAAVLRLLPAAAFLLNPARGPLVVEAALLQALREGWIAGAALDTHYHYPMPADHPLWSMPNVIMTPHISGSSLSPKYLDRTWELLAENVRRLCAGEPLLNELTQEQLAGA